MKQLVPANLVLAIDTTHEFGSLALASNDALLEEVPLHAPAGFGQVLYAHLGHLLARHGVKPAMIDCFAAASGPGSFTGVRVGLACVKGLGGGGRQARGRGRESGSHGHIRNRAFPRRGNGCPAR